MTEQFYYETPSFDRQADIMDYLWEFAAANVEPHGTGSLDRVLQGWSFDQALDHCLNMEREDYAAQQGRCPGKTLLLIRQSDSRLVGTVNIRWNLPPAMLRFAGHIGYAIRPTEQRRGYGKINLYMGLM